MTRLRRNALVDWWLHRRHCLWLRKYKWNVISSRKPEITLKKSQNLVLNPKNHKTQ